MYSELFAVMVRSSLLLSQRHLKGFLDPPFGGAYLDFVSVTLELN